MQGEEYARGGRERDRYERNEVVEWPCPLCGDTRGELLKHERGALGVQVCASCSLIRINPRLEHPEEIYQGDTLTYEEEFREILAGRKRHHRDDNYERDLALIAKHKPSGNFLDIGTNAGSFLRLARNRGWKLTGVEPSPQLVALARRWWGLDVVEGFVEQVDLPKANYDVVTLTDVFEHVVNPKEMLGAIRELLKPDGILFLKVPNARFNLMKFRGRKLLGRTGTDDFDSYEHVVHYTDETLRKMLVTSGFEPFDVSVERPVQLPMWHKMVGHYYQHQSPFLFDWQTRTARELLYQGALVEAALTGHVGWLAPNIGCFARLAPTSAAS